MVKYSKMVAVILVKSKSVSPSVFLVTLRKRQVNGLSHKSIKTEGKGEQTEVPRKKTMASVKIDVSQRFCHLWDTSIFTLAMGFFLGTSVCSPFPSVLIDLCESPFTCRFHRVRKNREGETVTVSSMPAAVQFADSTGCRLQSTSCPMAHGASWHIN